MSDVEKPPIDKSSNDSQVQGEGDYESARRFRKDSENFLKKADVPDLARRAAPKSPEEAEELKKAEAVGRSHRAGAPEADNPNNKGPAAK